MITEKLLVHSDARHAKQTLALLDIILTAGMSDKSWLAEQKNIVEKTEKLREQITGEKIKEVKYKRT